MNQITTISGTGVNCYLIQNESVNILIDTGHREDFERIEEHLKEKKITRNDLNLIILTHGHMDHAGGARLFQEKYKCPIIMHQDDFAIQKMHFKSISGGIIYLFSKKELGLAPDFIPDICTFDSRELKSFGFQGRLISIPGHTKGSIGVLLDSGEFICGDLYMNNSKPRLFSIYNNWEQLKQSDNKIKKINVKKLYPGHGKPFIIDKIL